MLIPTSPRLDGIFDRDSHAEPDLRSAAAHRIRKHAVDACGRQQEREPAENSQQNGVESLGSDGTGYHFLK